MSFEFARRNEIDIFTKTAGHGKIISGSVEPHARLVESPTSYHACGDAQIKWRCLSMDKERKDQIIKEFARHEGDTGSPEVQVALLTERINHLN